MLAWFVWLDRLVYTFIISFQCMSFSILIHFLHLFFLFLSIFFFLFPFFAFSELTLIIFIFWFIFNLVWAVLFSSKAVTCLAFSMDGFTLVSGSEDGMVRVWDTKSQHVTRVLKHGKGARPISSWWSPLLTVYKHVSKFFLCCIYSINWNLLTSLSSTINMFYPCVSIPLIDHHNKDSYF